MKRELLTVASPFIGVHAHAINGASCGDRYCDRQSKAIWSVSELIVFFVLQSVCAIRTELGYKCLTNSNANER